MGKNLTIAVLAVLSISFLIYAVYNKKMVEKSVEAANAQIEQCQQISKLAQGEALKAEQMAKEAQQRAIAALKEAEAQRILAEEALKVAEKGK